MSLFASIFESGALGALIKGGVFMWPILLLAIIGIGAAIERWRSLKLLDVDSSELRQQVIDLLSEDRVEEALEVCDKAQGPVAAILSNGVRKYLVLRRLGYDPARIEEQVVKSMENYGVHVVAALERHLPIIATVAAVAPMLGFLGTVAGMIGSFADIQADTSQNIVMAAAAGIEVALHTTAFGLMVGIPAFMAFNYFTSIVNGFVLEVESSASELIEAVTLRMTLEDNEEGSAEAAERGALAT